MIALVAVLVAAALGVGGVAWAGLAKPRHPVPNLVHETSAQAARALAPLHLQLRVSRQAYDQQVAKGLIISQAVAPTKKLREGSSVSVVVSLGLPPVRVPDLTGLAVQDADNRLIGAGFKVGTTTYRYDNLAQKGVVLSWTGQGKQLTEGSTVDLVASNGKPVVTITSVAGGTFAAAQATLAALNLTAVENDVFSNTVTKGQVVGTSPAAGTSVQIGTKVTVNVSKGPDLVTVPRVATQSVGAATQALEADGFNVTGVTGNPINTVTRTSPPAGAQVLRGSSVTLFTN